jgi:prevent-host-death family protein
MSRPVFTTSDLSRRSGDIIAEAMRQPVTITQRDKPRLVVLSIEDYERLREYADHRWVGTIEDMPDDLFEDLVQAVEDYANSPDEVASGVR